MVAKVEKIKSTELIVINDLIKIKKDKVIAVFSNPKTLSGYIKMLDEQADNFDAPDLSTVKGRKAIATNSYSASTTKTTMTKALDAALADEKKLIANANAGKKYIMTELDRIRDKIRAPLNKWEADELEKEVKRKKEIKLNIAGIVNLGIIKPDMTQEEISSIIEGVDCIDCSEGFDEFAQDALQAKASSKESLAAELNRLIQADIAEKAQIEVAKKGALLKIQERLGVLQMIPTGFFGKSSKEISKKINSLNKYIVDPAEFGESYETALSSVKTVVSQLQNMFLQQKENDFSDALYENQEIDKAAIEKQRLYDDATKQPSHDLESEPVDNNSTVNLNDFVPYRTMEGVAVNDHPSDCKGCPDCQSSSPLSDAITNEAMGEEFGDPEEITLSSASHEKHGDVKRMTFYFSNGQNVSFEVCKNDSKSKLVSTLFGIADMIAQEIK